MYEQGLGVTPDSQAALQWYRLAAAQGDTDAQANLAALLRNGRSPTGKDTETLQSYRLAADKGDASAQFRLGQIYERGDGVAQDYLQALSWYQKAAEQGNQHAQFRLGLMYQQGQGVEKNARQAAYWYRGAARQGNAQANYALGLLHEFGNGVTKNEREAKRLYQLAAEQGYTEAQYRLGVLYSTTGQYDFDAAVKWLRKAADGGHADAQARLGHLYRDGWGVRRDYAEAKTLFTAAAAKGNVAGQWGLGWLYANGLGVPLDMTEAKKWYQLAADQGDKYAQSQLRWIAANRFDGANALSLIPKYGFDRQHFADQAAQERFLEQVDTEHDRGTPATNADRLAQAGWRDLRRNLVAPAMQFFNRAWLINPKEGNALWGIAAILGSQKETMAESLRLFNEAAPLLGNDIDFATDHARAIVYAGVAADNQSQVEAALPKFADIFARAPEHVLNLQNWAIALYHLEQYNEAWQKIALAEAAPRRAALDPVFIADLEAKMPRPK